MNTDEPLMAGMPATLNHEKGVAHSSGRREGIGGRGKWVDLRNGAEAIPTDDEPDPAQGSRTLN
jgi:hypothetical protein